MEKRKVAMVLVTEPNVGGGHQYALEVAESLKELPDSEYELVAICRNRFWRKWCRENHIQFHSCNQLDQECKQIIRNCKFPRYSRIYNTYTTELGKLVRRERIDVLFVTAYVYVPNVKAQMIIPVHDLMHRYEPSFPEVKNDYQWRELVFNYWARCADYILTDSKLGKRQFIESYLRKSKMRPRIVTLPYIAPRYVTETKQEYIDVPEQYVFYPAQFWKHKNHINLIKAIQLLKGEIKDVHLVLVGSEKNCGREIKSYIADNGLENNITIKGFVSNENLVYLYRHALGMIMPSYFGPTNIPPLEAMALGCPVAVSNRYAMPEQVGDAGLLFNPDSPEEIAECIKKLWVDKEFREEMIKRGYCRVNRWTKEKFKNKLLTVIEAAANKKYGEFRICGKDRL